MSPSSTRPPRRQRAHQRIRRLPRIRQLIRRLPRIRQLIRRLPRIRQPTQLFRPHCPLKRHCPRRHPRPHYLLLSQRLRSLSLVACGSAPGITSSSRAAGSILPRTPILLITVIHQLITLPSPRDGPTENGRLSDGRPFAQLLILHTGTFMNVTGAFASPMSPLVL